jgi:hypothetical protein
MDMIHIGSFDLVHHVTAKSPEAADAITKARLAGVSWQTIIATLFAQLPNILAGNWAAVIAAIMALVIPPTPKPA